MALTPSNHGNDQGPYQSSQNPPSPTTWGSKKGVGSSESREWAKLGVRLNCNDRLRTSGNGVCRRPGWWRERWERDFCQAFRSRYAFPRFEHFVMLLHELDSREQRRTGNEPHFWVGISPRLHRQSSFKLHNRLLTRIFCYMKIFLHANSSLISLNSLVLKVSHPRSFSTLLPHLPHPQQLRPSSNPDLVWQALHRGF